MSFRSLLIAGLILVAAALVLMPQSEAQEADAPRELLGLTFHRYTLDNGLEVIVVPNKTVPLVTIEIAVKTGAYTEDPDTDGLAHLYEHMFFKGNESIPDQEGFKKRVQELGISYNGTTTDEAVRYFFTLPSKRLDEGMEFMSQAILTPLFDEGELNRERPVVIEEYNRSESNPYFFLNRAVNQKLFHKLYHKKNAIGDREIILSATREQMYFFKNLFYVPNNSALFVIGDVDPQETLALAKKYLAGWERGPDPFTEYTLEEHPPITETQYVVVHQPVNTGVIYAGWHGPNVDTNPEATYALDCWGAMLGLPTGKWHKAMVESQLALSASMSYYTQKHGSEISFWGVAAPDKLFKVRNAWKAEMVKFDDPDYFTEKDLEDAKKQLRISMLYDMEEGREYAQSLAFWWCVADLDYYLNYLTNINAVTLEDVRGAVREHVLNQPMVIGAMSNPQIAGAIGLTEENLADPDYDFNMPGAPATAVGIENLGDNLYRIETANGLPVLFRRVSTNQVVAAKLFVSGGSRNIPENQDGVEHMLFNTLLRGSTDLPREELQRFQVETGTGFSTESNYDYTTVSFKSLAETFGPSIAAFGSLLQNPAYAKDDIAFVRNQLVNALQQQQDDPDEQVYYVANDVFFAGHPYYRYPKGTLKSIPALTAEQLKAHHKKILNTNQLLLVVVGDLEPAELQAEVNRNLGWIPTFDANLPDLPAFPSAETPGIKIDDRDIPAAYVVSKFTAPDPNAPDYIATRIGLSILSNRIYQVLRTEKSFCYATWCGIAQYNANYAYLYMTTQYPDAAAHFMHAEINRTLADGVRQEEIDLLANEFYTGFFMGQEVNDTQAHVLGSSYLLYGDPLQSWKAVEAVSKLTAADVNTALRAVMKNPHHFGVIGPASKIDPEILQGNKKYTGPMTVEELQKLNESQQENGGGEEGN
jgi:zinc protease